MRRVAAPLAAILCLLAAAGCGDGAEPGAPQGATLMLDFTPNAVHTGIYVAAHRGYFEDEGIDLTIREPAATSDAPKLLQAGRVDFAVMDINDFGIARQEGLDLVAIAAVVQRPLAAVIAADRREVERPLDLTGGRVGVTGVPSDDAVLDEVLRSDRVDPDQVDRVNIGFNSVAALAAAKVDAATAFWNAEGVQLREMGIPTNEFRVDEYGAPRYPELVVATTPKLLNDGDFTACAFSLGMARGYTALENDPEGALDDLLAENDQLVRGSQQLQLDALLKGEAFRPSVGEPGASPDLTTLPVMSWLKWATRNALISPEKGEVTDGFVLGLGRECRLAKSGESTD